MTTRTRVLNGVLVLLSVANVVSVWFAVQPGGAAHATIHAALALGFGLWAQRRMLADVVRPPGLQSGSSVEVPGLRDEVGDVQRELAAVQERLDFTEQLLSRSREGDRPPGRREP